MKNSLESTLRKIEKNATLVYDVFTHWSTRNFAVCQGEKLIWRGFSSSEHWQPMR